MKLSHFRKLISQLPQNADTQNAQWLSDYVRRMGVQPGDIYQELEMESRFADCHRDISYPGTKVNLHSHNFYELLYCTNNCGVEYLVGTERYRLQKGDIVLISPDVCHSPLLPEDMTLPYERIVLWISEATVEHFRALFPEFFSDSVEYSQLLRTEGTHLAYISELFEAGVREAEAQAPGWEMALLGNTTMLLAHLSRAFRGHSIDKLQAETPDLMGRIAAYIEDHYTQPISLDDLSRRFYISGSTISHLFQQKLGVSFYRFVTQRRLIAAKRLIENGVAMQTVASSVGFGDYSGFFRAFKQEYGISPRQYRQLQEQQGKN